MTAKKAQKKSKSSTNNKINNNNINYKELLETQLKKKYLYLLMGLTVFVMGYFVFSIFFYRNQTQTTSEIQETEQTELLSNGKSKNYVVKSGDNLWKIAENNYGSGYNAYDIAQHNKIKDPNIIDVGVKLELPEVSPKNPTQGEIVSVATDKVTLTADKYTVRSGDHLWKIALQAYGDGYAWLKIAKANNLTNPNLIYPGNVLNIPR